MNNQSLISLLREAADIIETQVASKTDWDHPSNVVNGLRDAADELEKDYCDCVSTDYSLTANGYKCMKCKRLADHKWSKPKEEVEKECDHDFPHSMHYAKCKKCGIHLSSLWLKDMAQPKNRQKKIKPLEDYYSKSDIKQISDMWNKVNELISAHNQRLEDE